jgi:REP element-mobilizing transposase RayT
MPHNSQKRFIELGYIYFITVNTDQKINYFKEEILCQLFIDHLLFCKRIKQFELYSFCLNLDHFHLILKPSSKANISQIMHYFKRNFSRYANLILGYNQYDIQQLINKKKLLLSGKNLSSNLEGDNNYCRLQDLNHCIINLQLKYSNKPKKYPRLPKFKWQKSFHDHVIRDQKDLENHLHYTEYNYLKHHLKENWQYTSKNYTDLIDKII